MTAFRRMLSNHSGASAAEYAIILAIIGTGIALAAVGLSGSISGSMNNASTTIEDCGGSC